MTEAKRNFMKLTLEEKQERVKDLRPIDDVFFEVFADDIQVMQEILRTILEDDGLIVKDVVVQSSERNLYGRSVRLDALCQLSSGSKVNVEVQRSDRDDHSKRVRFNASVITARDSSPGDRYEDILELYVVYISEFDIFRKGKTIYHVENVIQETGDVLDDGLHRVFVNTEIDDGTPIASLMSCFTKKMVSNPSFPKVSERITELKTTEGGQNAVCAVMEKYMQKARAEGLAEGYAKALAEGREEGRAEGIEKSEMESIRNLMEAMKLSVQKAMDILKIDPSRREKYASMLKQDYADSF